MSANLQKLLKQESALRELISNYEKDLSARLLAASRAESAVSELEAKYPALKVASNSPSVPPGARSAYSTAIGNRAGERGRLEMNRAGTINAKDKLVEVDAEIRKLDSKRAAMPTKAEIDRKNAKDALDATKIVADRDKQAAAIQKSITEAEYKLLEANGIFDSLNKYGSYPDGSPPKKGMTKKAALDAALKNVESARNYVAKLKDDLKFLDQRNQTKEKLNNAAYHAAVYAGDKVKAAELEQEKKLNDEFKRTVATAVNNGSYVPGYSYNPKSPHGALPSKGSRGGRRGQPGPLRGF